MCGIIGITSNKEVTSRIVNSLKKLGSDATSFHTRNNNVIEVEPERKELGYVGVPKKINSNFIP